MKSFIIIGAGASGIILAAQLLRRSPESTARIFERSGRLGAGIAYATENPSHLLNVRASNMSAFPDQPDHFLNWLQESGDRWEPHSFAPRKVYRAYLEHLVEPYLSAGSSRLTIERTGVVDVALKAGRPAVVTETGETFAADAVILATGNEAAIAKSGGQIAEYWASNGYFDVPTDAPVAIFGTGLSMIDSVLSLLDNGHRAEIYAVSRRGLLPARHAPAQFFPRRSRRPSGLARAFQAHATRAHHDGGSGKIGFRLARRDGRSAAAYTACLGGVADLTASQFPPASAPMVGCPSSPHGSCRGGSHRICHEARTTQNHGRSSRFSARRRGGMEIRYRPRRSEKIEKQHVATVIDCRGGNPRFSTTRNAALIGLMEHGLARPDVLDLGLDVTRDLQLLNARGEPSGPFFAIGPVTKGAFWEVTAVPDIRVQAERLSAILLEG